MASVAMRRAAARCSADPTTARSESSATIGCATAPTLTLSSRSRRTEASIRSREMSPRSTAATTALIARRVSVGFRSMSEPARTAITALCSIV